MNKFYCKKCGALNPVNSKFCEKCGSNEFELKKDKTIIIAGVVVGIIAILFITLIVVFATSYKTKTTSTNVQISDNNKKPAEKKKAEKEILSTDYKTFNEPYKAMTDIQRDNYYKKVKGQWVQWSGTIIEVKENYICIKCLDDTYTYDIQCFVVDKEKNNLINLQRDQPISIEGKIDIQGGDFLPWGLNECTIIKK